MTQEQNKKIFTWFSIFMLILAGVRLVQFSEIRMRYLCYYHSRAREKLATDMCNLTSQSILFNTNQGKKRYYREKMSVNMTIKYCHLSEIFIDNLAYFCHQYFLIPICFTQCTPPVSSWSNRPLLSGVTAVVHGCSVCALDYNLGEETGFIMATLQEGSENARNHTRLHS